MPAHAERAGCCAGVGGFGAGIGAGIGASIGASIGDSIGDSEFCGQAIVGKRPGDGIDQWPRPVGARRALPLQSHGAGGVLGDFPRSFGSKAMQGVVAVGFVAAQAVDGAVVGKDAVAGAVRPRCEERSRGERTRVLIARYQRFSVVKQGGQASTMRVDGGGVIASGDL